MPTIQQLIRSVVSEKIAKIKKWLKYTKLRSSKFFFFEKIKMEYSRPKELDFFNFSISFVKPLNKLVGFETELKIYFSLKPIPNKNHNKGILGPLFHFCPHRKIFFCF
jgi:hypothetical protein